jgi:hypothetical protein
VTESDLQEIAERRAKGVVRGDDFERIAKALREAWAENKRLRDSLGHEAAGRHRSAVPVGIGTTASGATRSVQEAATAPPGSM